MEECIEKILSRDLPKKLHGLRRAVFLGGSEWERIENELVADVCDAYFRTRNPRKTVGRKYSFREYQEALGDAGYAFDGEGGVAGVSGLPEMYFYDEEAAGNNGAGEGDGAPVMAVEIPFGSLDMIRISVSPQTFSRHLRSFVTAVPEIRARLREELFRLRREMGVASIEFPYLEQRLAETIGKKNISYKLTRTAGGNVLSVQIVKEIWMKGFLSTENVERVVAMTPYFILRPDRLKYEMPDYRIVKIYGSRR